MTRPQYLHRVAVSQLVWPDGRRCRNRLVLITSPLAALPIWQKPPFCLEGRAEDGGELQGETRHTLWWGGTLTVHPDMLELR